VRKKSKSCKFLVPTSLWRLPLRFLLCFCSDWFSFGLCPDACFFSAWNRLYWRETLISVDFLYQNLKVIFYSHIKEPGGLVCLKPLCGVFMLFCLEQSSCDSWLLTEEDLGLASRCDMLRCEVNMGPGDPVLCAFSPQRVWVVQLVPLTLVPHISLGLPSMCEGVPEKMVVYCSCFVFWSRLFTLWAKSEYSMDKWREWVSRGEYPGVDVMHISWKEGSRWKILFSV